MAEAAQKSRKASTLDRHRLTPRPPRGLLDQHVPAGHLQLLAEQLLRTRLLVCTVGDDVELPGFFVEDASEVDVVFGELLLFGLLLHVSLLVLVQNHVLCLETLLGIGVALVQHLECIGGRFGIISDEGLTVDIGRREHFIGILAMLLLFESPLLLELLLLLGVIEMPVDGVITMCLPVLLTQVLRLLLHLILDPLLVMLVVYVGDDIVLLLVVLQQFLLAFDRQSHLPILEEVIRHLLVIDHVVSIANWAHLASREVLLVGLVGFQVDDVEVLLVLQGLLLN
jgi:hypothetical protein